MQNKCCDLLKEYIVCVNTEYTYRCYEILEFIERMKCVGF